METLRLLVHLPKPSLVFELPMRDGNAGTSRTGPQPHHVFELPMRDGNRRRLGQHQVSNRVFELPMRDGNCLFNLNPRKSFLKFLNFL